MPTQPPVQAVLLTVFSISLAVGHFTTVHADANYYVATNGRDDWSGKSEAPNADQTDGPFRTLGRARDAVRAHVAKIGLDVPLAVNVRGGKYYLSETIKLSLAGSGTAKSPVIWRACPGEKPILSGGLTLGGWVTHQGQILKTKVPNGVTIPKPARQLFFNGKRQTRARWPQEGWAQVSGAASPGSHIAFQYKPDMFPDKLARPKQIEVNIFPYVGWTNNIVPIQSINREGRVVWLTRKVWDASDVAPWFWGMPILEENRYALENVLEELDQPGEWVLDAEDRTVYFWPPEEMDQNSEVVLPVLDTLIALHAAQHIHIVGLTFTETTGGDKYHRHGLDGYGAMYPIRDWKYCGEAMHMKDCAHCVIAKNHFDAVGGNAIYLEGYNLRNQISRNELSYVGANGICLLGTKDRHPMFNQVTDNHIHHCGAINNYIGGVFLGVSDGNIVAHNSIHDMPHHAVNLASNGYGRNYVEFNDIRRVSTELFESPGINGWMDEVDVSKSHVLRHAERAGHIVRHNYLEKTQGIAFDDYASNCVVYGNIIVGRMGVGTHGGKNNVFENNILVDCSQYAVLYSDSVSGRPACWQMQGFHGGIRCRNNILYCTKAAETADLYAIYHYSDRMIAESDYNLFFNALGRYVIHEDTSTFGATEIELDTWQEQSGHDRHSIVDDPLFVDPENGDYRLKPKSPAWKLGFQQIDASRIGIRPEM